MLENNSQWELNQFYLKKYMEQRRESRYHDCVRQNNKHFIEYLNSDMVTDFNKNNAQGKNFAKYDIRYRCAQRFKYEDPKLKEYEAAYLRIQA